jgi:uncharacterized membrane protein YfcA
VISTGAGETVWWLPALVAFAISSVTSTGGVSGAFLLLPFQVSVLGVEGPTASATNLLFNVVAIPAGVYRFQREGRMLWPLALTIVLASLPAMFLGALLRVTVFQDVRTFKLLVAAVLLVLGLRLAVDLLGERERAARVGGQRRVSARPFGLSSIGFEFEGVSYTVASWKVVLLGCGVGVVGGAYGVGGGALIAPFLVAVFGLPAHSIAGACLFGTFASSVAGVGFYAALDPFFAEGSLVIAPNWALGGLLGAGGAVGIYLGARLQRFVPERVIKGILAVASLLIVARYSIDYFFR